MPERTMPEQARPILSFLLGICRQARLLSTAYVELNMQTYCRQLVPLTHCTYAQHEYSRRSPVTTARISCAYVNVFCPSAGKLEGKEVLRTPVEWP